MKPVNKGRVFVKFVCPLPTQTGTAWVAILYQYVGIRYSVD